MIKLRNVNIDIIKGLCIIMVVAIHTIDVKVYESFFGFLIRNIFNCAVPIFLGLSGYLINTKIKYNNNKEYWSFIKKRIHRIYIPTLFWSLPFFLYNIYKGNPLIKSLLLFFICGYGVFYFIAVLLQYNLLIRLMLYISKKTKRVFVALLISVSYVFIINYILHIKGYSLPLILYAGFFPLWIVFFVFGIYLKTKNLFSFKISLICSLLFLVISALETYYYSNGFSSPIALGIKPSSFLFSFFMLQSVVYYTKMEVTFFNRKKLFFYIKKALANIGMISFGIYLNHIPIVILLKKTNLNNSIIIFVLTLITSIFIIYLSKILLPKKVYNFIGF